MTTPFISATDLSTRLGRDVSADPMTVIVLDAACEVVRTYTDQQINVVLNDPVTLDGRGMFTLHLPQSPVLGIDSITEDGTLLTAAQYIQGSGGVLYRQNDASDLVYWANGLQNIDVVYDHGYSITEPPPSGQERVPSDLRFVTLSLAARMFYSHTPEKLSDMSLQREERWILNRYALSPVTVG